jgi:hypothetical protein
MEYSTPELVVLGSASSLVLGDQIGGDENGSSGVTRLPVGLVAGLDD